MATSGEDALAFCSDTPPDLVLLDVLMPGLDGLEVCRKLKSDPETAGIPVIFVTAQSDVEDETRALEAGGVDFITKPFNPAVVKARVSTQLTLKAQSDLLRSLAFLDGLTGVANRRRFDEALDAECRRCRRSGAPLALIMVDIDHFKAYNDFYGHQNGDACLRAIAMTLKARFGRSHDLVARYGGEEFVCLMPECDLAAGRAKADEIRAAVVALRIPHCTSPSCDVVTISVGIAVADTTSECTATDLVAAADRGLYQAKRAGRNQVACAGDLAPA
jgi:diguanylate cyclase (GGDEF)-like protein